MTRRLAIYTNVFIKILIPLEIIYLKPFYWIMKEERIYNEEEVLVSVLLLFFRLRWCRKLRLWSYLLSLYYIYIIEWMIVYKTKIISGGLNDLIHFSTFLLCISLFLYIFSSLFIVLMCLFLVHLFFFFFVLFSKVGLFILCKKIFFAQFLVTNTTLWSFSLYWIWWAK